MFSITNHNFNNHQTHMKKIFILAVSALAIVACSKEPGSVSGSVFYKYNDYVGNKPDAGSTIKLYNVDKSAEPAKYEVTTDVQGNYKISGVVPADYLLFIQSKTTTAKATDVLSQLSANAKEAKEVFGVDAEKISKQIEELKVIEVKQTEAYANAMEHLDAGDKYVKEYGQHIKDSKAKLNSILDALPKDMQNLLAISEGYGPKLEIKKVTVAEAKDSQNNTDFGITYK